MHLRRSFATTAAAVLITAPLLSSCGFNLSTDRVSDNTVGLDDRSGDASGGVDVLAAVVVAAQPDSGTFIATLSNTSPTEEATFESVEGQEDGTATSGDDVEPITIAPQGFVNLADGGGVKLTGSFEAGDVLPLTIGFASGQSVRMNVVVVRACAPYEGLDPEVTESATPSASPTDAPETLGASGSATPLASEAPTPSESGATDAAEPSDEPSASASAYSCEFPSIGSTEDSGEGE